MTRRATLRAELRAVDALIDGAFDAAISPAGDLDEAALPEIKALERTRNSILDEIAEHRLDVPCAY